MDFQFLRSAGLRYIEELGSKIWTDYNAHDPGITTLEVLCYALTELGYRTSFDMKDLLAAEDGRIERSQAFFRAKDILTSAPLTVEDYRKLLIDIEGVRNAWLYPFRDENRHLSGKPSQEVPLYAHCKEDKLTYEETEHPIELSGLYRVVLDLEETDEFGNLNDGKLLYQFPDEELQGIQFELLFPVWDEVDYLFFQQAPVESLSDPEVSLLKDRWQVSVDVSDGGSTQRLTFQVAVPGKKMPDDLANKVTDQLGNPAQLGALYGLYQQKLQRIHRILLSAKTVLHGNRNLCEDFLPLETVCIREVAICADIEVAPGADVEEVYARVLFELENYLDPRVRFYTLKELVDQGIPTHDIFQGPVLSHGFIKTDELKQTRPRVRILVSDIINFIMDIEGVRSVKNVLLTQYGRDGKPVKSGARWCLSLDAGCKPALSVLRSKVLFFKGKLPFKPRMDETLDTLRYLRGLASQDKLSGSADDFPLPEGTFRPLDEYVSIEQEFPMTYGIGRAGLPESASPERKAQAKQLKNYLRFFDQLLANFLAQLAHAKSLFSLDPDLGQTYFGQYLDPTHGAEELYRDATLLRQVFQPPTPGDPDEVKQVRSLLLESPSMFAERRNRFLDHLLARFSESFNEYVLMQYAYRNATDYEKLDTTTLIKDKLAFLADYPVISSRRGQAFNYLEPAWDTENVSGFEKRIARMAGIRDFGRRFLFCLNRLEIQKTTGTPKRYFFQVVDEEGTVRLKSSQEYDSPAAIARIVAQLQELLTRMEAYRPVGEAPGEFAFELVNADEQVLAVSGTSFADAATRDAVILDTIDKLSQECPGEGLHLVEHLLLRPRFEAPEIPGSLPEEVYRLFQVCLGEDCQFCGEEDPYSFRVSIILPYWHERFKAVEFRDYFETMARTEAPAHCMLKICWVNNTQLNTFERAYKEWMEALAQFEADIRPDPSVRDRLRAASNELIEILTGLHSEYPIAQLHDCETGTSNPVLLNNTILGTYIKSNSDE